MSICQGVLIKDGERCTRRARANGYCGYHKATILPVEMSICQGILVKDGEKCTRRARENGYCGYHKAQANEDSPDIAKVGRTRLPCVSAREISDTRPAIVDRKLMVCAEADDATLATMKGLVDSFSSQDKIFIGKASAGNPPEKRWSQKYESIGYERMMVICRTPTVEGALWLEKELIKHFKRIDGINIKNPIGGGGGAKGKDPGYLYVVLG